MDIVTGKSKKQRAPIVENIFYGELEALGGIKIIEDLQHH